MNKNKLVVHYFLFLSQKYKHRGRVKHPAPNEPCLKEWLRERLSLSRI